MARARWDILRRLAAVAAVWVVAAASSTGCDRATPADEARAPAAGPSAPAGATPVVAPVAAVPGVTKSPGRKAMVEELMCMKCHDAPLKRFSHTPFAKGECLVCHEPYGSEATHKAPAARKTATCLSCHEDMKAALATAAVVHRPATESCTTCHEPHASEFPMQIKGPVGQTCLSCHEKVKERAATARVAHGAMLEERACVNCHTPHASGQPHMLKARADEVCLTCHDRAQTASDGRTIADMRPSLAAKFLHGPVKGANCSACHEVHGSANDGLLKQPFPKS